jgi:hypothetical protein
MLHKDTNEKEPGSWSKNPLSASKWTECLSGEKLTTKTLRTLRFTKNTKKCFELMEFQSNN